MTASNLYFAESWRRGDAGGFCLSCYLFPRATVAAFSRGWDAVLRGSGVAYLRMSSLAHGSGNFRSVPLEERQSLERRLIDLVCEHSLVGVAACVVVTADAAPADSSVYRICFARVLDAVAEWSVDREFDCPLGYFLVQDQRDQRVATGLLSGSAALPTSLPYGFHSFGQKRRLPPLQAADMLAWLTLQGVPRNNDAPWRFRKDIEGLLRPQDSIHAVLPGREAVRIWPAATRTA